MGRPYPSPLSMDQLGIDQRNMTRSTWLMIPTNFRNTEPNHHFSLGNVSNICRAALTEQEKFYPYYKSGTFPLSKRIIAMRVQRNFYYFHGQNGIFKTYAFVFSCYDNEKKQALTKMPEGARTSASRIRSPLLENDGFCYASHSVFGKRGPRWTFLGEF